MDDGKVVDQYQASWKAIMQQVRDGSSWSGYERNCAFLNTGGQFADVSHVSGLNFSDDGRGIAVTDWDQDGDLDLWFRNRTAPRLRLMLNQSRPERASRHLAFRLTGTECNRDAIGAVVEVHLEGSDRRLVRSVRAGEMYLSQSSKWVHFGLPEDAKVTGVSVLWPGGVRSTYEGIEVGNRYGVQQGESSVRRIERRRKLTLEDAPLPTVSASSGQASIVLPAPVGLPISSYVDEAGKRTSLSKADSPCLLLLWSAGCDHCQKELAQFTKIPDDFKVLALCVDGSGAEQREIARDLIAKTGFAGNWGMIGANQVEQVHVLQEALFDSTPKLAVPLSFLLRPGNEIVAIYRGPISSKVVSYDCQTAARAPDVALRNLAPPFPGRWFTLSAPPAFLPNMIVRRMQERYPEEALPYLHRAAEKSGIIAKQKLFAELGLRHYFFAAKFASEQKMGKSDDHYLKSIEADPRNPSVHNDFGSSLAGRGRLEEGRKHFSEALRLKPDFPLARKNLAKVTELLEKAGK
ncbi:MAG: hypothetical protein CBC46_13265 [Verrucomicrobiaceae bacterium TMED86]|nr:MAG: hypothetical protein CBC46_13265 [Verrucomicrobiaceae bacterium TMED86]